MRKQISLYLLLSISINSFAWVTPSLSSPSNGSIQWTRTNFNWNAVASSESYEIQIDTTPNFNSVAFQNKVETYINSSSNNFDTQEPFSDLYFGTTYYWRVRAWVTGDTSAWSTVRYIDTYNYVPKSSPSNGSLNWTRLNLNWNSHEGVDFYEVQLDTTPNFNSVVLDTRLDTYINSSSSNTDTEETYTDLYFGMTYYWRVRAINAVDTSSWAGYRSFSTYNYVPKSSPSNGSLNWTRLNLNWNSHNGVDFYEVQLDTTPNFNSAVLDTRLDTYINSSSSNTDTEETYTDLYFGMTYYWRVRAINAVDTSSWLGYWSFDTYDFVPLVSPSNFAVNQPTTGVGLNWNSHNGVNFYEVQWDTTNAFNSGVLQSQTTTYVNSSNNNSDTYYNTGSLLANQTYHWRVRAINAVDTSIWTSRVFSTGASITIPQIPSLISPLDLASVTTIPILLTWSSSSNAISYEIQYSSNANFSTYVTNATSSNSFSIATLPNGTYFWRVRAINGGYLSSWSAIWSFNLNVIIPCSNTSSTLTPISCGNFTSPAGNTYSASGTYTDVISNVAGCDSTITINLFVNSSYNLTESISICSGGSYTFPDGITQSGINSQVVYTSYLSTLTTGCDSIITTTVNVNQVYNLSEAISLCNGDDFTFPDGTLQTNISTSTSYISNLTSSLGCDSIVTTNITVVSSSSSSIITSSCGSYVSPSGASYTSSGTFIDIIPNVAGCDSIITINLTVNPTYNLVETVNLCNGENYTFPDGTTQNNISSSLSYSSSLQTIFGCDSLIETIINITTIDTTITQSGNILTSNEIGANYQWFDCNNGILVSEINATYTAVFNGDYSVEITQNGCVETSACQQVNGLGVSDYNLTTFVRIYPSPTNGTVTFQFENVQEQISISIYDISGKMLVQKTYYNIFQDSLEIVGENGLYFIKIVCGNSFYLKRVVKQ